MSRSAEEIKEDVLQLPDDELKAFRAWYEQFDADRWDRQIEEDARRGKLDELAEEALNDHRSGKTKRL